MTVYGSCEGSPAKDRTESVNSLLTDDEEIEVSQGTSKKKIDKIDRTGVVKSDIDSTDESERLIAVVSDENSLEKETGFEDTSNMNVSQSLLASIEIDEDIREDLDNLDVEEDQFRKEDTFSETNSDKEDLNSEKMNPRINVETQPKLRLA